MKIIFITIFLSIQIFATNISDFINKNNCDKVIDKQVFQICYSYKNKGAFYVGYELNGTLVNKANIKKRASFYNEKTIPMQYRSKSSDYKKSGYDRGHLAPDAAFDYNKKVLRKTYTMANVIPQVPRVNRYTWIKAERYARSIAYKLGRVTVINGVIYEDNPKRIGKNQIAVPSGYWKMIANDEQNFQKCFYYENNNDIITKKDKLKQHQVECSTLIKQ